MRTIGVAFSMLAFALSLGVHGDANAQNTSVYGQQPAANSPFANGRPAAAPIVGDAARGETLFRECAICHAVLPNEKKIGPSLAGLMGRTPGGIFDFGYSQDMINFGTAGNFWDEETLDRFLSNPRALLQRTKMAFPGFKKDQDRADLIAYLATL